MVDPIAGQDPLAVLWRMVDANPAFAGHKLRGLIAEIEARMAAQLVEIIHQPRFLALEAAWRGARQLVDSAAVDPGVKIRVLHLTREELAEDLGEPGAFEDSRLFAKLYDDEIGTTGGEPYGALIGDYSFANHPDDLPLLAELAGIGAAVLAPVIVGADPQLLGLDDFRGLASVKRLSASFATPQYAKWRTLRDNGDTRFLCLALPRVLARLPYRKDGASSGDVPIEEDTLRAALQHQEHCWMNAAYVVGASLIGAFARDGWWRTLADVEAPALRAEGAVAATTAQELGQLGLLPVATGEGAARPAIGSATVYKPKAYRDLAQTADAAIAVRLPCLMTTSRFAQYLMVMVREAEQRLGNDLWSQNLGRWLGRYAHSDPPTIPEQDLPLIGAEVRVERTAGGHAAILSIRPRLADETLTAEVRIALPLPWLDG